MTQALQSFLDGATIAPDVIELRPDYRVMLVAIDGIPPGPSDSISETLLEEVEAATRERIKTQPILEIPHVIAWREAYKAFGTKPNKYRNSLESLTRRVDAGLPRVNRLTDIYNAISVKHQIPFGGEDMDKYDGPPRLVRATGAEDFEVVANGVQSIEHPDVGEVVWCDGAGVTCRRWNWRQGPRTALTDRSSRVLFIMDALEPASDEALDAAVDELVAVLEKISPKLQVARRLLGGA